MKRLIATILVTLGFVFVQVGTAVGATQRFWKVDIFDPAASTVNRTLNIAYNVFSTLPDDNDYTVELFENSVSKGTQAITHANGDSGAFSISIPANGTYTYKVVATNSDAGETKESSEKTVQVVDGPAPVVQTVATGGSGAGGGSGSGSGIPGDANGDGVVDDQAAVAAVQSAQDDANKEAVQGAQKTDDSKDSNQAVWWAVVVGLLLLGGGYYLLRIRRANQA